MSDAIEAHLDETRRVPPPAGFVQHARITDRSLHDEADATLRFGCAWTQMSTEAARLVDAWTQRAQRRRQVLSLALDL